MRSEIEIEMYWKERMVHWGVRMTSNLEKLDECRMTSNLERLDECRMTSHMGWREYNGTGCIHFFSIRLAYLIENCYLLNSCVYLVFF
jgi:hypothetical protein